MINGPVMIAGAILIHGGLQQPEGIAGWTYAIGWAVLVAGIFL